MARREQQHEMCECPSNILDNPAGKHFQYTCASLGDSLQGISYISNSGKNIPSLEKSDQSLNKEIRSLCYKFSKPHVLLLVISQLKMH